MDFPKLAPKAWGAVIVGGIGIGFLLKKKAKAGTTKVAPSTAATANTDVSGYGLADSSSGPYAGYGTAQGAGSYAGASPTSTAQNATSGVPAVQQELLDALNAQYIADQKARIANLTQAPSTPATSNPVSSTPATPTPTAPAADPLASLRGHFVNANGNYYAVQADGLVYNENAQQVVAHTPNGANRINVTDPGLIAALSKYTGVLG